MIPGEYLLDGPDLELNAGRPVVTLSVNNTGDRPIQVGSHYHFFETNRALVFDREKAYGMRPGPAQRHVGAIRARRRQGGAVDPLRRPPRRLRLQRPGDRAGSTTRSRGRRASSECQDQGFGDKPSKDVADSRRSRQHVTQPGPSHERPTLPEGLRQEVRPDRRRPNPAGRQRADHRDRARLHRLRRGVDLRRRQVDPGRAGSMPDRTSR